MPRKKQAESAKTRRQKLLDYFHSHPRQARFISDVKDDLNIKNEQNLRRDLELLAEGNYLEKTKDTSKLPARTVYTLKEGAPKHLQAQADDVQQEVAAPQTTGKVGRPSKAAAAKQAAEKPAPAAAEAKPAAGGDVKGRRSARELEQRILSLLEQQPTTVKDLADHLKRQQPTVTKALERMQERRLVERKRLGRSFVYSQLSRGSSAAPAAVAAAVTAPVAAAAAAPVASQATDTGSFGGGNLDLQSIIETAIRTGITVALEHIGKSR